jgi:hypothetical protein
MDIFIGVVLVLVIIYLAGENAHLRFKNRMADIYIAQLEKKLDKEE